MKISAINSFYTNNKIIKCCRGWVNPNFCSKITSDQFIKNWKENNPTPLDKEDAKTILDAGNVLLKQYNASTTEEEKDEAISSYKKTISSTLHKKENEYRVLRHYLGNKFSTGEFLNYTIAKEIKKDEAEKQKIIERIVKDTENIINFDKSLRCNGSDKKNKHTIKSIFIQTLKNEEDILKRRNIKVDVSNINILSNKTIGPYSFENYTIMSNLIQNAIKYSPDNSTIKINFVEEEVLKKGKIPAYDRKLNILFFEIEDEGIGIPKENQQNILEEGIRGDNVGSISGTGQGLNDVKKAINGNYQEFIQIISPLKEDEPIYKGTKIRCPLNV